MDKSTKRPPQPLSAERAWHISYERYNIAPEIELPPTDSSLLDMLEHSFLQYADNVAYIAGRQTLTYAELDRYSLAIAHHLQTLGLSAEDTVGVMLPNILQYPLMAVATVRSGVKLVGLNPTAVLRELEMQMVDAQVKVLVMLDYFSPTFAKLSPSICANLKAIVVCRSGDLVASQTKLVGAGVRALINTVMAVPLPNCLYHKSDYPPSATIPSTNTADYRDDPLAPLTKFGFYYFSEWLTPPQGVSYQRPNLTLNHPALLQYTGGTTGTPKGALLSHQNIFANLLQIDNLLRSAYQEDSQHSTDIVLVALPLYHVFSFTLGCMLLLYRGFTGLLIANPRDSLALVKAMKRHPPSFILGVNPLFSALLQQPAFRRLDFSHLKATIGGGMAILPSIAKRWHAITGLPIIEGYGLSETAPVAVFNPLTIAEFTDKVGIPAPSTDVILVDNQDRPVPIGARGELMIKGPQVMQGYQNMPTATANAFTVNGYLRTGDIGIMDERGFIKIVDRKKDMLVVSGFNVYPNEIESVMLEHPDIAECVVIGIPHPKRGEEPKIFVVSRNSALTEAQVIAYGKAHLTAYKRPRHVSFVDSLPKSAVGKVLRKELRKREGLE